MGWEDIRNFNISLAGKVLLAIYIYMIMIIIRSNNIIIVDNNNKHVICTYLNSVQSF